MAATRWRARLLAVIVALVPFPVAASAAAEQMPAPAAPAQPAPAQPAPAQPPAEQPTLSLTLEVTANALRFDAGPSLTVSVGNLVDTCQFASGVTYHDVHVRLEVTDSTATLACSTAGADQQATPGAEDDVDDGAGPASAEAP